MTGLYPHSHGITANIHEVGCSVHELEDRATLLPRRLQAAGYSTGYTGKWHLGTDKKTTFQSSNRPSLPSTIGFEGQDFPGHGGDGSGYRLYRDWLAQKELTHTLKPWTETTKKVRADFGVLDLLTDATVPYFLVDRTIEMIEQFHKRAKPFFVSLNFWGPHGPYFATQEFMDLYRDVEIPPWPNFEWDSRKTPGPHHYKIHWDKESLSWEDWAMAVRYYYARTSMIDSQIGRLYQHLLQTSLLEDTVIIFTADHGQTLGSHGGLLDKGWHHFEETHRIPLIIRMPDGELRGNIRDEFTSSVDMYPTILDMAGVDKAVADVHGRSLLFLIRGDKIAWRDAVVTEFLGLGNIGTCMKTIRVGNIKYGYNLTWQDELYDLGRDPFEMHNLINDPGYAEDVEELKDRLEQWMAVTSDPALRMYRWHRKKSPER
jgi:arylsulfatase A-like enzyme